MELGTPAANSVVADLSAAFDPRAAAWDKAVGVQEMASFAGVVAAAAGAAVVADCWLQVALESMEQGCPPRLAAEGVVEAYPVEVVVEQASGLWLEGWQVRPPVQSRVLEAVDD